MERIYSKCLSCQHRTDFKSFFINVSVPEQIKNLFRKPGFYTSLQHRFARITSVGMSDVYDGALYHSLSRPGQFLSFGEHISFQWNTDGVPLFHSSAFSMWPFYLKINELPIRIRDCLSNKLLAGVWFGTQKPSINTFLKPFCDTMKSLYEDGLVVQSPDLLSPFICRAIVLSGTCDMPAKATALNMINHNGFYACPYCEQPGQTESVGRGNVHVYPYLTRNPDGPKRSHSSVQMCSKLSMNGTLREKGINAPGTCLLTLPLYDVVKGTGIDYMHCVLLNVTRFLVNLWFDSSHHTEAWSCSRRLHLADSRLKSIRPPSCITRAPKSLVERKASEYHSWLFFYSLPIMLSILPSSYYKHYSLLCQAIHTLNSCSITRSSLEKARNMLKRYYSHFSNLYGERYLTCNMHQLLHLADSVEQLGPLYTFSCFDHESANGALARMVHSNCGLDKQIMHTFSTVQTMCSIAAENDVQVQYLDDALHYSKPVARQQTKLLGACDIVKVDNVTSRLLQPYMLNIPETIKQYARVQVNNTIYHGDIYDRISRHNNTVISFRMLSISKGFGVISSFLLVAQDIFVVVNPLLSKQVQLVNNSFISACHVNPSSHQLLYQLMQYCQKLCTCVSQIYQTLCS